MIYFDVTKASGAAHRSGLTRVSARLLEELGTAATPVIWKNRGWVSAATNERIIMTAADWLLTAELFCEEERPGFWTFLQERHVRTAAIFHDAIPLRYPQITWPQSVARHPEYMKMLAAFDRVFAVSRTSADDLTGFWRWQEVEARARVETLLLGADFSPTLKANQARGADRGEKPLLLCVGILEPRKNQTFLLEICEELWAAGLSFELAIVGRVNPHFGKPLGRQIATLRRNGRAVSHHAGIDDRALGELYRRATASVFPTIAEGCGLPPLESLWLGVPCICSDLPVLRETALGPGCELIPLNDRGAWTLILRRIITDTAWRDQFREDASRRVVPRWIQTAERLRSFLT